MIDAMSAARPVVAGLAVHHGPGLAAADPGGQLRVAATKLEAAFLAEMLRHAGLGATREAFGGGAGEAAFSGTLVQEYAGLIADAGGVGLADSIFRALTARSAP